ncbi:MAG: dienelactone hydrolase family protein, partial [Patulibacter minatonensis]
IAQRAASFGFVTIAFDVNNTFLDFPTSRSQQLLAALDFVTSTAKERTLVDPAREAVVGHSMGGGATLEASRERPALKAAVGLAPWNPQIAFEDVSVPSLEIGAQNDFIAPVKDNARFFYDSLPNSTPKAYTEFSGLGHLGTNSASARVGAATVAWLKRYVDEDTRYTPFICGAHTAINANELSAYASNC